MFSQLDKSLARCEDLHEKLLNEGYAILDNVFEQDLLGALRDEVEFLDNSEWLEPSGNKLQRDECDVERTIVNKPGVFERSIVMKSEVVAGEATMELVPNLSEFYYQRDRIAFSLSNNTKLSITALDQVKIARIKHGGAFMVHTDTTPKKDRVLTMTLYLNSSKSDYDPLQDGGQLRLYPLSKHCIPSIVDVFPIYGRAVLFSSNNLPHRVMPCLSDCRYCVSFFFYGESLFPLPSPSCSSMSNILSSFASKDLFGSLFRFDEGDEEINVELQALLSRIRQSYPDVLSALIHREEYCISMAQAFTMINVIKNNCFDDLIRSIDDEVVRDAMIHFYHRCNMLEEQVDTDIKAYVKSARKYLEENCKIPVAII